MEPSDASGLYWYRSGLVEVVDRRHNFESERQVVWTREDGTILQKSYMAHGGVTRIVEPLDIWDVEWEGDFDAAPQYA